MEDRKEHHLNVFKKGPVLRYGFIASFIYLIFGLILFLMTIYILKFGNYNPSMSGYVSVQLFIMSITASVLAAYRASRDPEETGLSKKMRSLSGICAALIASLFPVLVFAGLSLFFINDDIFSSLLALQFYIAPVPAAVIGGLIGYFIEGNSSFFGTGGGIKKYAMIVSAVLLLEFALFLIIIYGAIGLDFGPFDPGRIMVP